MGNNDIRAVIEGGKAILGVEFGSTRIKAVLVDETGTPIAQGDHEWENQLVNGIWTYDLGDAVAGLQDCYANMAKDVREKYGCEITRLQAIGFSAMMHGYIVFNDKNELLVPFRTWRNTITGEAAAKLTELFGFNIPQRWSIAHLYQAILNGEEHVKDIRFMTTLEGYIHWIMTGEKVLGIGEGSGMFPIDSATNDYNAEMVKKFDDLVADKGFPWKLKEILPKVLVAGEVVGRLTEEGAKLLDPTGRLQPGIPLCPPEGDAQTGMVATNSVRQRTGNVSAGTSIFAMIVLEKPLSKVRPELENITTPSGAQVAMVHCNNCTSDLNAWVKLFGEFAEAAGFKLDPGTLFGTLYRKAMEADPDLGNLLSYNYYSGEHITGFTEGRPMFIRTPGSRFTLANFMRSHLNAAFASLKIGMDILTEEEGALVDRIMGHGGIFKTKGVAQHIMSAALNAPVSVMETAGEGGAWGIALLAAYMALKNDGETLEDFLDNRIFADMPCDTVQPNPAQVKAFNAYIVRFKSGLPVGHAAVKYVKL